MNANSVEANFMDQRLFPDIRFTCNGLISKWIVGAGIVGNSSTSLTELQIWRRDSIKENRFTKVNYSILPLTMQAIGSNVNVYEYAPNPPLEFQDGDILGVYQPGQQDSQLAVYYQENDGPENYRSDSSVSTFTLVEPASRYDYPLVTVEIISGEPTAMISKTTEPFQVTPSVATAASTMKKTHTVEPDPLIITKPTNKGVDKLALCLQA